MTDEEQLPLRVVMGYDTDDELIEAWFGCCIIKNKPKKEAKK